MARSKTERVASENMGQIINAMVKDYSGKRQQFERRWYDANFFDDGFHFRYVSKVNNRVIDLSERQSNNIPQRALPKASRQIRGIANLLTQINPQPTIYPEKVMQTMYQDPQQYQMALQQAKDIARKVGAWMEEEWKKMGFKDLMTRMIILAAKHGVSFMQIYPDAVEEKICAKVYDAFDIYLAGELSCISDSPAIIKTTPKYIAEIKANEMFDEEQLQRISPDNKYASSEIKEAYMQARYSTGMASDHSATLIEHEAFIKEYLNDDNWEAVARKGKKYKVMDKKKKGDMVMRHVFTAGGVTLLDEYIDLPDYPFVDFRLEPGPIYQTALIERFIPLNKSLDIMASRIEAFANTMVSGAWVKRRGEDFQINNVPGGQIIEYETAPPTQANMTNIPPYAFNYMEFLEKMIEEQGASTSALGQLPSGVKSGIAIESLKATEYANLKIASDQVKLTAKRIAEKMIDLASKHFIQPQTVYLLEEGEPKYFDIIGQRGIEGRQQAGLDVPNAIPIKEDYMVDIQVESGMGYTAEGKRQTMQQVVSFIMQLAQGGYLTQPAVMEVVKKFLETFEFGSTAEFMEAMEQGLQSSPMNEQQLMQMKVAVAETLKDTGAVGQQKDDADITKSKIGVVEAMKDLAQGGGENAPAQNQ